MSEVSLPDSASSRWLELEALFHAAGDLTGDEQARFIDRETGGNPELQEQLMTLLRHSGGAPQRIAGTIERVAERASGASHWTGRHFGPYRIVRELGRGGMGVVFEARRDDSEYDKTVALKVAPDWRDLDRLRERFRNERQIMANLDHTSIAHFLDGGTEDGIPYFAMEYIDGKTVTVWAAERNIGLRDRVVLFRKICAAVAYAHENLIVHRDLKPGNILVDVNGTPKLLDFGIATLLDSMVGSSSTTTGARLWTPDYASPEQVRGGPVTVRTDVYSLGLILYELLCEERAQVSDPSSPLALDRSICESDPVPPSARAAARGDRALGRQLRGDLDTIVAMAIRKEPERRYPSAAALDADLDRFLDGRPVIARHNTVLYRASKLVRRHRLMSLGVTLLSLSVAGGVSASLYQARRAEQRFQQVRSLANSFLFDVHDRIQYLPGSTEARKAIVATALHYLEILRKDRGNDPGLLRELAVAYEKVGDAQGNPLGSSLGDSLGALESYRSAETILKPLAASGDQAARLEMASTVYKLGTLEYTRGSATGTVQLEQARGMVRQLIAEQPTNLAALGLGINADADLARVASNKREPQHAFDAARESLGFAQRIMQLNPARPESQDYFAIAKTSLASAYRGSGDLTGAAEIYRAVAAIRERLVREHPDNTSYRRLLLLTYGHLGDTLGLPEAEGMGMLSEAELSYEKAAETADWISRRDPSDRTPRFDLAVAHMRTAACLLEEPHGAGKALTHLSLEETLLLGLIKEDSLNQRYRYYAFVLDCHMGKALADIGRDAEAERRLEHARATIPDFRGGQNERGAKSWGLKATLRLAQLKAKAGDRVSGIALADSVAAGMMNGLSQGNDWNHALGYGRLGLLYLKLGQNNAATLWLQKSAEAWRKIRVPAVLEGKRGEELAKVERHLRE